MLSDKDMSRNVHCQLAGSERQTATPAGITTRSESMGREVNFPERCVSICRHDSHFTGTTSWTDPRSLQPVPLEDYDWKALPPSWERQLTDAGDIYYVW